MTLQTPFAILPEMADLVTALADTQPYDVHGLLQLRRRARAILDGVVGEIEERPPLTPRERDALDVLKTKSGSHRRPVTTAAIAVELLVDDSWAYRLLARLREKGYVERVGAHKRGGWALAVLSGSGPYIP